MSKLDTLIKNDGFIYCIKTNLKYNDKNIAVYYFSVKPALIWHFLVKNGNPEQK